jgi:ribulose-5-phosphate 4-epimerase/fuculose-1-phosphate aldolase
VHTHSPGVVPFSVSRTPLKPLYHNAAFLGDGAPVWDIGKEFGTTDMLVRNNAIGKSLATALGGQSVVLMRGHGDVTVGASVKVAVFRAYYTDVNAKLQAQALGLGTEVTYLSADEATKADAVNMVIMDRAWTLWRQRVQTGK